MATSWLNFGVRQFCCTSTGPGCIRSLEAETADGDSIPKVQAKKEPRPTFLPAGPQELRSPAFLIGGAEELSGPPLFCGNLLQLDIGEAIHEVTLALYINGFIISPCLPGVNGRSNMVIRLWSPLALVEKCQVKAASHSSLWAVFKLTIFRKEGLDLCYYFACTGKDAQVQRESWVEAMSSSIENVTLSLFPDFAVKVQPIPGKDQTSKRLLAGYLLQGGSADFVTLVYCELHCYSGGKANMVMYKDEWCEHEIMSIPITDSSTVSTRRGAHCTVFGVDLHRFAARSRDEKELWLRAVSNVKVKLMFEAPDPTSGDIEVFRKAVTERVEAMPLHTPRRLPNTWDCIEASEGAHAAPVLEELPRAPPDRPEGDVEDPPEPLELEGPPRAPGNGGIYSPSGPDFQHIPTDDTDLDVDAAAGGTVSPAAAGGQPTCRNPRNLFTDSLRTGAGGCSARRTSIESGGSPRKDSKTGTWGSRVDDLEPEACRKLLRGIAGRIQRSREESKALAVSKSNSADAAAGPDLRGSSSPTSPNSSEKPQFQDERHEPTAATATAATATTATSATAAAAAAAARATGVDPEGTDWDERYL